MASGGHRAGESWDSGMIPVTVNFTSVGIKKESTFEVKLRRSSCIGDVKHHLKTSKGITGKLTINNEELSDEMTLAEANIVAGTVLVMESYTPAKVFTHNIPVKIPNGKVINVKVHNGTTIGDLKHKIQDEICMPVEKQSLEYGGRPVRMKELPVEICRHEKTPIILKYQARKCSGNIIIGKGIQKPGGSMVRMRHIFVCMM